jgi:hypothetical protein
VQWGNGRQKWCDSNDLVGRQDFDTNCRKGDYS